MYECDVCGIECERRIKIGGMRVCDDCAKGIRESDSAHPLHLITRDRGVLITKRNRARTIALIERRLGRIRGNNETNRYGS